MLKDLVIERDIPRVVQNSHLSTLTFSARQSLEVQRTDNPNILDRPLQGLHSVWSRLITDAQHDAMTAKYDIGFVGTSRDIESNAEMMERLMFTWGTSNCGLVKGMRGLQDILDSDLQ